MMQGIQHGCVQVIKIKSQLLSQTLDSTIADYLES